MAVGSASVVLICLAEDLEAARALGGLSAALREPEEDCRIVSLESLVAGIREGLGPQKEWAESFAMRYLRDQADHPRRAPRHRLGVARAVTRRSTGVGP